MLITQSFSWPAANWPNLTTAATQYTVLQVFPVISDPVVTTVTGGVTSAFLTFDDSIPTAYQVRASSGTSPSLVYGPEVSVFVNGYVPCRAYIRQEARRALADRSDTIGATVTWPDDELNGYIRDALVELNQLFPTEQSIQIPLVSTPFNGYTGRRDYDLPADFFSARTIEYVTADSKLRLYLKEKPFKGGESTATSYLGYPKLGILLSPLAGRYYPGHYDVFENQLHIDWDPAGDGDYLNLRYAGRRLLPANDADILNVKPEDVTLLLLRTQVLAWLRFEANDTRLSRWRTREDGSKRDDMPTIKMSAEIQKIYNQIVIDRRELRPKVRRLVRR